MCYIQKAEGRNVSLLHDVLHDVQQEQTKLRDKATQEGREMDWTRDFAAA